MAPTIPGLLAAVVVAWGGSVAPLPARTVETVAAHAINATAEAMAIRRGVRWKRPLVVRLVDRPQMRAARDALAEPRAPETVRDQADLFALLGLEPPAVASGARPPATPPEIGGLYDVPTGRMLVGSWRDLGADRLALDRDIGLAVLDRRFDLRRWLGAVEPVPPARVATETAGGGRSANPSPAGDGPAPTRVAIRGAARTTVRPSARARLGGGRSAVGPDDDRVDLQSDAALARQALVEGDAAVQALERLDPEGNLPPPRELAAVLDEVRATIAAESAGLSPRALGERLFLELDGLDFVARIRARAPWRAVDAVWARPPQSTEQILHPDKYDRREPPDDVGARLPARLRGDFRVALGDTLGELGTRVFLARAGNDYRAERAAAGWGGDRVLLVRAWGTPKSTAPSSSSSSSSMAPPSSAMSSSEMSQASASAAVATDADASPFALWITTWDDASDAEDFAAEAGRVLAAMARVPSAADQPGAERLRVTDAAGRIYALDRSRRTVGVLFGAPAEAESVLGDLMSAAAGRVPTTLRPRRAQGRVRFK